MGKIKKKVPFVVKQIQKYQPLKINFAYQKNISYSQLSIYNECPYRWKLQYVDKIKTFTSSIYTIFGTAIHETIQHYLTVMYEQSISKADEENLIEIFEEALRKEYKREYKNNHSQHFSSSKELQEFYNDGVEIINYFKKNKSKYFSKRGWYLVGCEVPVVLKPNPYYPNIIYQGFLDVVLYHEPTNTFKIIDLKSSTWGWKKKKKQDEMVKSQLVLYKTFFSQQFDIPIDNIEVEFFILKRKLYENTEYTIPRIQTFTPASGKVKLGKANKLINSFIVENFQPNGEFKENKEYKPKASKSTCLFCPFLDNKEICKYGKH